MCVYELMRMYECVYIYMSVCVCMSVCLYVCVCACMSVCMFVCVRSMPSHVNGTHGVIVIFSTSIRIKFHPQPLHKGCRNGRHG